MRQPSGARRAAGTSVWRKPAAGWWTNPAPSGGNGCAHPAAPLGGSPRHRAAAGTRGRALFASCPDVLFGSRRKAPAKFHQGARHQLASRPGTTLQETIDITKGPVFVVMEINRHLFSSRELPQGCDQLLVLHPAIDGIQGIVRRLRPDRQPGESLLAPDVVGGQVGDRPIQPAPELDLY